MEPEEEKNRFITPWVVAAAADLLVEFHALNSGAVWVGRLRLSEV